MIGAVIADAGTTLLVLPMVALQGDMLGRFHQVGIRPLIWSLDCRQLASLVIESAEAACTQSFLGYAITASDYRPCISQLGWYVRQIRTQSVWLTATLPPVMQEEFVEYNKLVRLQVIRESTNRSNIRYVVTREKGAGTLVEKAARLVQSC
ncbi:hypothetical protein F5882DRAFT_423072 [Hyaloscypha sp. PMI_1271]|nr:hypothetical protein F5882DRAFT_423072 [Hyaloscypha sp. PMI_1271]